MRKLGRWIFLLPLVGLAVVGASCGARTSLPGEDLPGSGGGESAGGAGGQGSVSHSSTASVSSSSSSSSGTGGGTNHPVISSSPSSFVQAETSVARAENGFVAVAWIDIPMSGKSTIGYAISTSDGDTFGPPATIASPAGRLASDPSVAVDAAGNFYVAWVGYYADAQGNPSDMHVYVAKAAKGATSFGAPLEVSNPAFANQTHDKPWITITSDGTLVVTYAVATKVQSRLVASHSKDGLSWQESVILQGASAFWNLAYPCAPKGGKRLWVTYLTFTNDVAVGLTYSDDDGQTWIPLLQNTTVSLPSEPVSFDDPTCVAQGNEVWVSYGLSKEPPGQMESTKSYAIRLAHSSDGGKTIDARIDAHDGAAGPFYIHPQMALEQSGAIDLVYYAGKMDKDKAGVYRWSRSDKPLGGFSPSAAVESPVTFLQDRADPRWLGDYTGAFWTGKKLYNSYVVNATGTSHVAFARVATP